jgi:hypothetical protein
VATAHFNVHPKSSIKLDDISKKYVNWLILNKNSNHCLINAQFTLNLCYAVPGVVTMYQPPCDVDHYDDTIHDYPYLFYNTIFCNFDLIYYLLSFILLQPCLPWSWNNPLPINFDE